MAVTISIMYVALSRLRKKFYYGDPFSAVVFPSGCLVLSTPLTGRAFCSSSFLIFLILAPIVWGVELLYCCNCPSLGVVLSLLTTSKLRLSSSPPLNRHLLFALEVQPHLSLYSWWLIVYAPRGSFCHYISSILMIDTGCHRCCCKPLTAWIN